MFMMSCYHVTMVMPAPIEGRSDMMLMPQFPAHIAAFDQVGNFDKAVGPARHLITQVYIFCCLLY